MHHADIRIGFVPIARPTFDLGLARRLTTQVYDAISGAGYTVIGSQDLIMDGGAIDERIAELASAEIDMILMLQASFADSTMVLQLAKALPAPLLMWARPGEQVGLQTFKGDLSLQWDLILVMTMLTALPITFVFGFLQKYITSGIVTTGMKQAFSAYCSLRCICLFALRYDQVQHQSQEGNGDRVV